MAITGLIFPDVNEYHPVLDFDKASSAGIVGWRARDDSSDGSPHWDDKAVYHWKGFANRGLVQLVYTVEDVGVTGAQAYQRLANAVPWVPGIIYVGDVESGGLTGGQGQAFVDAAHKDGNPAGAYGSASSVAAIKGEDVSWVAKYSSPAPAGADIWQFTGFKNGEQPWSFPGVGYCDMNKCIADINVLRHISGLEGSMADYMKNFWAGWKAARAGLPFNLDKPFDWRVGHIAFRDAASLPAPAAPAPHNHDNLYAAKKHPHTGSTTIAQ